MDFLSVFCCVGLNTDDNKTHYTLRRLCKYTDDSMNHQHFARKLIALTSVTDEEKRCILQNSFREIKSRFDQTIFDRVCMGDHLDFLEYYRDNFFDLKFDGNYVIDVLCDYKQFDVLLFLLDNILANPTAKCLTSAIEHLRNDVFIAACDHSGFALLLEDMKDGSEDDNQIETNLFTDLMVIAHRTPASEDSQIYKDRICRYITWRLVQLDPAFDDDI